MIAGAPQVVADGRVFSPIEVEREVSLAIGRLRALGVREGERVALWAENSPQWIAVALAVLRAGAVLVPLNTRLADAEVAWQVGRAAPSVVIAGDAMAGRAIGAARVVPLREWEGLAPAEGDPAARDHSPARDAAIVFTSGTTGRPKGAVLTLANLLASARASASVLPLGPGDRWLAPLPFFHVGGLGIVVRCALAGAGVVLCAGASGEDLDRAVEAHGVTHLSVVDATLRRLMEARGGRALPASVRAVVAGGGPVSPALLAACPQALATYGLTETASMVALERPGERREGRLVAGRALPGIDLRVDAGGVIEVRGPVVMRGYLDDAAATAAAVRDGWLRTGDLGEIGADGSLTVLARRDDLIVSGGENVYPAEIELALREHPAVADAVVVGVADARWGEVPLAVVQLRGGAVAPDLRDFLTGRLARYKLPRIVFAPQIPRLANGKPDRAAVRRSPPG